MAGQTGGAAGALSEYVLSFLAMGVLVILSAFFSGSETALFSLTGYERLHLQERGGRLGRLAERLLRDPGYLLLVILFSNLAVNVLVFSISSVVAYRLAAGRHMVAAGAVSVATLLFLVLFGEMLPKATAYFMRVPLAKFAAGPLFTIGVVLRPVMNLMRRLVVLPGLRVLTGLHTEQELQREELQELLEAYHHEDFIQEDQLELLKNVVELKDLRVAKLMVPRVDLVLCDEQDPVDEVRRLLRENNLSAAPVYREDREHIVGVVRRRRIELEHPARLDEVLEPVFFVPEQQRVDQLVHAFQHHREEVAAVVDEYGGFSGLVRLADVAEELLGVFGLAEAAAPRPLVRPIDGQRAVADGGLEIGEFCAHFRVPPPEIDVDTLAGLVMALCGHLPAPGERVTYDRLTLEVRTVQRRRIREVTVVDGDAKDGG